jgi:hypothetical protein
MSKKHQQDLKWSHTHNRNYNRPIQPPAALDLNVKVGDLKWKHCAQRQQMQEDTEKTHTLSLHQTTRNSTIMGFRRGKQIYTEDSSSYKNPNTGTGS